MNKLDVVFGALRRAVDEARQPTQGGRARYTPGEFLKYAGTIIAVCLGLAVLSQLLVMIAGEY